MPDSVLFAKASSERIEFNKGTLVGTGAYSLACVIKLTTITTDAGLVSLHSGAFAAKASMGFDSSGNVVLNTDGSGTFDTGDAVTTGNGWVIVGISKGAGSVVPRVHIYRQPTWRHAAMGGAVANSGASTGFAIACTDPGESYLDGNMLICAAWDRAIADAEFNALAEGYAAWIEARPVEGIRVNALTGLASFVSGGTMSETGNTGGTVDTGDVPAWWNDDAVRPTVQDRKILFSGRQS